MDFIHFIVNIFAPPMGTVAVGILGWCIVWSIFSVVCEGILVVAESIPKLVTWIQRRRIERRWRKRITKKTYP